jgi:hypothetical protein
MANFKKTMNRMFPRAMEGGVDQSLVGGFYLSTVGIPEAGYELAGWVESDVERSLRQGFGVPVNTASHPKESCGKCDDCPRAVSVAKY